MRLLQTLVFMTVTLQATFARCRRLRPNMMVPPKTLSPGNAERTMQMVKMATQRLHSNTCGNQPATPVQYSPPMLPLPEVPCNLPNQPSIAKINQLPSTNSLMPCALSQMPSQLPNLLPVQLPNPMPVQLPSPTPIQPPNPTQYQLPSPTQFQLPGPTQFQLPSPTQFQLPSPTQFQLPCPTQIQLPNPTQFQLPTPAQFQLPSPTQFQLPNPTQFQLPSPTQFQLPTSTQIQLPSVTQVQQPTPTQMPLPNPTPIQMPNLTPTISISTQNLPETVFEKPVALPFPCQRDIPYPSTEITSNLFNPPNAEISETVVPLTPNQEIYGCPIPSPAALFNPLLPAASPVSSWTQENLPTAFNGARSQYLRKVPIPPPTL